MYVIVTMSRSDDLLERFLASVREAGETCLVAVADDGLVRKDWSEFGSVELVTGPVFDERSGGRVFRFIFSRSANVMLRRFPDHDVFLANDDTRLLGSGSPIQFLEETSKTENVGIVSPAVDSSACHAVQQNNAELVRMGIEPRDVVRDAGDDPFYFCGVYISARTRNQVGLLDEGKLNGNEDTEYSSRCRQAGMRNIIDGRCEIWHQGGVSFRRLGLW